MNKTTTIDITPEWAHTCDWFARAMLDHSFVRGARTPMVSLIEQVRYLALADPAALDDILARLRAEDESR